MESVRMHPEVYEAAKVGALHSQNLGDVECLFLQTTQKGNNILHIAAQYKQVKLIDHLLQYPLGPSLLWQGNHKGDTPLHIAAKVGSDEAVQAFIDLVKSPHWVVEKGRVDAYKELLQKPNSHKDTALHYAIRGGHDRVVKLLIKADPQLCDITNAVNESPLYLAVHQRCSNIIELILNDSRESFSYKGPKGLTALHVAVHCSLSFEVVHSLLRCEPSVAYDLDKRKESALHIAASRGHLKIFEELVGSCPDACDMLNNKEQTALHLAVIGGRVNVVKYILRNQNLEDLIDQQDIDGNTALHLAVIYKQYRIMSRLARDGRVNCYATNKNHRTALDIYFASREVKSRRLVYGRLRKYYGFPVIQEWVSEEFNKTLDQQFIEDQPAGSITTGSNTPDRENVNSSLKSIIEVEQILAAFIATATFAAAFTMPGGYNSDKPNQGMATLAGKAAFITFVITNTIAFILSAMALFLQLSASALSDRKRVEFTSVAAFYICHAMLQMVIAFASGTYVVLTRITGLAIVPWVVCGCVGSHFIICYPESLEIIYIDPHIFFSKGLRAYGIMG
ncbi:hypothetical protein BT93_D1304 [Corymbia citriodora subsp. variegata]|nr:hypothetical protein BT93_D1304 [Corymbia citriodora subsp. variegata]